MAEWQLNINIDGKAIKIFFLFIKPGNDYSCRKFHPFYYTLGNIKALGISVHSFEAFICPVNAPLLVVCSAFVPIEQTVANSQFDFNPQCISYFYPAVLRSSPWIPDRARQNGANEFD